MQEEKDNQHHQDNRFHESLHHFVNGVMHHICGIQRHIVLHPGRKCLGQFRHARTNSLGYIQRITSRQLIDGDSSRRLSFQPGNNSVLGTAQLDSANVPQTEHFPLVFHSQYDVAELFGSRETSLYIQRILKIIIGRTADGLSHITGRHFHILTLNGRVNLLRSNIADTHGFGIQPYTHGVITGSHDIHRSHSRYTSQLVYQIQIGIIGQIEAIINTVTAQCKHHHNIG